MVDWNKYEQRYGKLQFGDDSHQPAPKKKKNKNFFLDQISTVLGTAGAIGGGILTAPTGPGAVAGAAGGGALGSGLGEAIENLITGDRGLDNVGKEAVLGGIFGGGPLKLAGMGGKALLGAGAKTAGREGVEALAGRGLAQAAKKTAGKNALTRQGRELYRATLGVDDILTPGKVKPTSIFKADELVDEAAQAGLRGSPKAMQRQAGVLFKDVGSQVDNALKPITSTAPITGKNGLFTIAKSKVGRDLPLRVDGVAATSEIQRIGNEMAEFAANGKLTASGLNQFKQRLSSRLSPAFTKLANGQDLTMKELVDMSFWRESDNLIGKLAPAAKELTKRQSRLYGLANGLATQTRSLGPANTVGEAVQRTIGRPFQAGQNALGRAGMRLGGEGVEAGSRQLGFGAAASMQPSTLRGFGGVTNRGITSRMGAKSLLGGSGGQEEPASLEDALMQQGTQNQTPGLPNGISGPLDQQTRQPIQQSPYSRENLMSDIQRDPENADKYLELFAMYDEIFNPETDEEKPLTEGQQGRADVITALGNVEGIMGGGSINYGPIGTRVEGLKSIFNAADPETLSYKNSLGQIRGAIAKARAGASMTPGELKLLDTYTPKDTDSEQVVRSKLTQLRALYGSQAPTGGATLEDALMQYQGGR